MSTALLQNSGFENKKGDLPAYYWPTLEIPSLFQTLKQQYDLGYLKNPLPTQFKEQLLVYLSQGRNLAYGIVCHSCQLYSLGVSGQEIFQLLQLPYPNTLEDLTFYDHYLETIAANNLTLSNDSSINSYLLPYCWLMIQSTHDHQLKTRLRSYLGDSFYGHLVSFLGYVQSYHCWLESYPSIDYQQDYRFRLYLDQLLADEPKLKDCFSFEKSENAFKVKANKTESCSQKSKINRQTTELSLVDSSSNTFPNIIYLTNNRGKKLKYITHNLFEKLYQKNKSLIQKNQSLQSFSYTLCHDLGAPLRAIEGFSQALEQQCRHCLDEKGNHYLQRIQANSQQTKQLIEDIFRLTQIDYSSLRTTSVNLSVLAEKIYNTLKEQEPNRNVTIEIEPDLTVKGDLGLLKIMMENLLRNAWKYTANQSNSKITIGFSNDRQAFFIKDNGVGFDMTYVNRLFKAFQRLHSGTDFQGNGIGLATVYRIIQRHSGKIWGEGIVNRGATFYFRL